MIADVLFSPYLMVAALIAVALWVRFSLPMFGREPFAHEEAPCQPTFEGATPGVTILTVNHESDCVRPPDGSCDCPGELQFITIEQFENLIGETVEPVE